MQTFLPYPDFSETVQVLDCRRLGKQRVEAWQILNAIHGAYRGWHSHPTIWMWQDYPEALVAYGIACCREWIRRGYNDNLLPQFKSFNLDWQNPIQPDWLGRPDFHRSHRSNLLRKDTIWYKQFKWDVPTDLPYVWPSRSAR